MKKTFPYRLKSARRRAGLSLRQLSEALNGLVSYNAIKKYEDGKMLPENEVLIALAQVLDVRVDYFSRPVKIQIAEVEFRKKSKLGKKQIEAIVQQTRDKLERYVEAEQLLGLSAIFHNPVKNREIATVEEVEEAAEETLNSWELGKNPIPNVIEMLEEKGVKVLEFSAPDKFDGLSTFVSSYPVMVLNKNFENERKRFTALHELGHLLLDIRNDAVKEQCCNRFAGAMLIPRKAMIRAMGQKRYSLPAMGELIALKEEYGLSIQALMRRAYELEIINGILYKEFCRQIARNRLEEGLGKYAGSEKSGRFLQLIFRLASEKILTMPEAARLSGLSMDQFRQLYYHNDHEEEGWLGVPEWSSFGRAYEADEPDYDLSDLKEINPDYDPR